MSPLSEFKNNVNQSLFLADTGFQELLKTLSLKPEELIHTLTSWSQNIPRWEALANEASRPEKLPRVEKYDHVGNPVEDIRVALETSVIREEVVAGGIFESQTELEKFARIYLLAQIGEAGVTCPLACTDGLIRVVEALGSETLKKEYLPLLKSRQFPLAGAQFITEQAGGSDVGAIEGVARKNADGTYAITAFKWYCSAFDEFFILAARPEGAPSGTDGIALFFVPRLIKAGEGKKVNAYSIRRLKNKMGTQSLPTAEIDFQGSTGYLLGKPEEGFHHLMNYVLNVSRVHNAANALAFHRRAFLEARNYVLQRTAFGKALIDFPLIQEYLLDMLAPLVLKRATYFNLVKRLDTIGWLPENNDERLWSRFLINLMKYRTACNLTEMVKTAILVFGANGIIEDFSIVPRLLRDSLIVETWEGPHNTLCLQIMRDANRFNFWPMLQKEINGYLDAWPKDQAPSARALYEQSFKGLMKQVSEINSPQAIAIHARRVVDHAAILVEAGCYVSLLQKQNNKEEGTKLVTHYLEKNLSAACGHYELSLAKWGSEEILKVIGAF